MFYSIIFDITFLSFKIAYYPWLYRKIARPLLSKIIVFQIFKQCFGSVYIRPNNIKYTKNTLLLPLFSFITRQNRYRYSNNRDLYSNEQLGKSIVIYIYYFITCVKSLYIILFIALLYGVLHYLYIRS